MNDQAFFTLQSARSRTQEGGPPLPEWALYPAGVLWAIGEEGLDTSGLNAVYASNVPRGSGLSSSASVEMAILLAWQILGGWTLAPMQRALLGQKAENRYVGVNCGIMDQFASACGVENKLLLLDCRSLEWKSIPLSEDVSIVIADTTVPRSSPSGSGTKWRSDRACRGCPKRTCGGVWRRRWTRSGSRSRRYGPLRSHQGEPQRVAVASTLATKPDVIILDEPTTGLDYRELQGMMALIQRLNTAGHTIVIITHAMDIAAAYARRVILMQGGRILRDGPTRDVFADEACIGRTGLTPPPAVVQVGNRLGGPALTLEELVSCLSRTAEPPNRRTPGPPS